MSKIYVGNLSWNTTDDALRQAFSQCGQVLDSIVMRDRDTGRSRGFGFVTYGTQDEANAAITSFNEQELDGRRVKVNMANARGGGSGAGGPSTYAPSGGYGGGGFTGAPGSYGHPGYGPGFQAQGGTFGGYAGQQGYGAYPGYQHQAGGGYGY
ncbi:RNA recognition domain-containing protein [Boletus reticuloceps]|uniref:RNA recognition domain-containing protein n=1 Tax=Boletus reticuloceps TaxID=495285 RepID=A0A8I2YU00_9AGAM|nr:RNA recognition domain-containing protein [Boletus reticuloceps]